jgi:hypothetical protein
MPRARDFDNVPHAFIWISIVLYHKHKNALSVSKNMMVGVAGES